MFGPISESRLIVMPLLDRSRCRDCRRNGLLRGAVNEEAYWKGKGQVAEKVGSGKNRPLSQPELVPSAPAIMMKKHCAFLPLMAKLI